MFEFYNGRKAKPEKEKVLNDIMKHFKSTVRKTNGEIIVDESCDKEGLVFINIKVGFVMDVGSHLLRFSEIAKNVLYMAIEPEGDMLSIRFGITDVFEE